MIIGWEDASAAVSKKCNPPPFSFFTHNILLNAALFFLSSSEELWRANKECHQVWVEDVTTLGGQRTKTALCPNV